MLARFILVILLLVSYYQMNGQGYPWNNPLKMAWSNDGINFESSSIFQDSSGVPCVIKWKGDTLISTFQWFRKPINSISWDRVAVKFSYNNGLSWTEPVPIIVDGLPTNYQRPFDPTLTVFDKDSLRIYFSSSNGIPKMGLDSNIDTYSAKSVDGINYTFEPNPRVNEPANRVIDPAVIYFNNAWHYISPVGSPQQGAYHYISPNGLNFTAVPIIKSDNQHNWTGNFMVNSSSELRFYGGSPAAIWHNSSLNGGVWNGYVNTNLQGGDPSVVRVNESKYLMIYVGKPYSTEVYTINSDNKVSIYPNPVSSIIYINSEFEKEEYNFEIYSSTGEKVAQGKTNSSAINVEYLFTGLYFIKFVDINNQISNKIFQFIKL